MLNKIRKFAKTKLAGVFVGILIIPFVLWGMGGVFSGGNANNVAKINNKNISTQDFMNFLNSSKIDQQSIRDNLDNNVLEQLISTLISEKLLEMEIENLDLQISENTLAKNIKKNPNFFDDSNEFSRIKYEKFLLSSNISATEFEMQLKINELKKKLFFYIGGGIRSPFFITNNVFNEQNTKINLEYINLNKVYSNKNTITNEDIEKFIKKNSEELKEEYISFSYLKITPQNLIGSSEYNQDFFNKIDEIENEILNDKPIGIIASSLKLNLIDKNNYIINDKSDPIEKKIYKMRDDKIQLFDEGNYFVLYQIHKIDKVLPETSNEKFKDKVTEILFQRNKYNYNKEILDKISNKKFTQESFESLIIRNSIKKEKIQLNSIDDYKIFKENSVKLIYSLPEKSFTLVNDKDDNIYLVKINTINNKNISRDSKEFIDYRNKGKTKLREQMYFSYDNFLDKKYKVKINQKTLERVKNYFK